MGSFSEATRVAIAAVLLVACSSHENQGPGVGAGDAATSDVRYGFGPTVTGIDGTWDLTFTSYPHYTRGTLVVSDATAQATLVSTEEGTPQGPNCTYVQSQDEIDLSLMATSVLGTNVHLQQLEGLGCPVNQTPGTVVVRHPLSGSDVATKVSTQASAFGNLGGQWNAMSPMGSCEVTFAGTTLGGNCADGTTFSATLNGNDLSGQSSGGFEFAAHRR